MPCCYGDDVIIGEDPACAQLWRAYEEFGRGVVGIKEVTPEQILRYSSLKVDPLRDNLYAVTDMIEKPTPDQDPFPVLHSRTVRTASVYL